MVTAIGISGSARKGGNSETLMAAVLEGTAAEGAATETVRLNELTHRGCQGCDACVKTGKCVIHDLDDVHARMRNAEIWVLASPVYYDSVNGQMKLFFDRLRPFSKVEKLSGRRAGLVVLTYEDKQRDDYTRTAEVLAGYLSWFGTFDPARTFCVPELSGPRDASKRPELLARAREIGRELVRALAGTTPAE